MAGAALSAADGCAGAWLRASGLPQRWQGRERFVMLDTDFDDGHAFVAAWRAWRDDPQRCGWLVMVAVAARVPSSAELRAAHGRHDDLFDRLLRAWPPPTPDLHTLAFEHGRVRLLLAIGSLRSRLPALRVQADALFGRASVFEADARLIELLGRKAATGATLVASADVGDTVRAPSALRGGGFVIRAPVGSDGIVVADHAPRFRPRRLPDPSAPGRNAVVVGAGIGGAATARALAQAGFEVTVLDRHPKPAAEASGNPAGLFHGVVHAGDGRYARLYRAAALRAHAIYDESIDGAGVPGNARGLLRLVLPPWNLASMQAVLARSALPPSHVQALDRDAASALAGVALAHPAWYYPGGGWIDPRAWVLQTLSQPGVRFVRRGHGGGGDGHSSDCRKRAVAFAGPRRRDDHPRRHGRAGAGCGHDGVGADALAARPLKGSDHLLGRLAGRADAVAYRAGRRRLCIAASRWRPGLRRHQRSGRCRTRSKPRPRAAVIR